MKFSLEPRDLINIGVFAVLYLVVVAAGGMMAMISPYMMFVGFALSIVFAGFVIILFLARTPKMGGLTIITLLCGLLMVMTGHPWFIVVASPVFGFLADAIATQMGRAQRLEPVRAIVAYAVMSMWYVVPLLPIVWNSEAYFNELAGEKNAEYARDMQALFTPTAILIWAIVAFVLSLIGGWLGVRAWRKHFSRAGLARRVR